MPTVAANGHKKLTTAFVLSNGSLISVDKLRQAALPLRKEAQSSEIHDERQASGRQSVPVIDPPYDLNELAALFEKNTTHYRAIKAKAEDAVGLGWTLVSKTDKADEGRRQQWLDFFEKINPEQTLEVVLENALIDFEGIGNGYIEVCRDLKTGRVGLLNHLPGRTMWRSKDMTLWLHQVGNKKVYYKRFGDEREFDRLTGQPADGKGLAPDELAQEVWPFIKYHPASDYYGIPDVIPALGGVLGEIFARDYNLDFFENGAVPAYAVIVEGADVTPDLKAAIESFFKHDLKGGGNQHRTIVIPTIEEGVTVKFEKLNVDIKDGSFKLYRQDNKEEILSAHGVPPARAMNFKQGALGGDITSQADKIYRETTVRKNRLMIERFMNAILSDLGENQLGFKFNRYRISDMGVIGSFLTAAKGSNAFTVNELREIASPLWEDGLDDVEGGDEVTVDVGGVPVPIAEAVGMDPLPPPPAPGAGGQPPEPEPEPDDAPQPGAKRLGYDDLDVDTIEVLNREYEGSKDSSILQALRMKNEAVNDMKRDLIKVFDSALRAAYKELSKQGGKRWILFKGAKNSGGGVRIGPILAAVEKHEDDFKEALRDGYARAMPIGAEFAAARLGATMNGKAVKDVVEIPDVEIDVRFDLKNPDVERWIERQSAAMSKNITVTLSNRIRRQLQKGIEKGESNEQIADRLRKTVGVPGLRDSAGRLITAETRSLMIARTETADAFNQGSVKGYRSTGFVKQVEVRDGDDFDEPCRQANGQTWTLRKAEGDSLEHPNCTRIFIPLVEE